MKNYITSDNKIRWHSDVTIHKVWNISRLRITFRMTAGNGFMGRLGGGWSWKLGAMGTGNEICLELIFFSIRFCLKRGEA